MLIWISRVAWNDLLARVQQLEMTMLTKTDLDNAIAALPAAVEAAVTPVLTPIASQLSALEASTGTDFSSEVASLQALPATISAAVTAVFAPPSPAALPPTAAPATTSTPASTAPNA